MIKLERNKSMMRAIDRARQLRPRVTFAGERRFNVRSARHPETTYLVVFAVDAGGRKFGACTCPAGHSGQVCYHLAAAAAVNIGIQGMRRRALPTTPGICEREMIAFLARQSGWVV